MDMSTQMMEVSSPISGRIELCIYIYIIYIYISCWQFEDTGNGKEHEMFIHIYGRNYSSWVPKRDPCQNVC